MNVVNIFDSTSAKSVSGVTQAEQKFYLMTRK